MTEEDGSITHWYRKLETGDGEAAQALWDRFFVRMAEVARRKLRDVSKADADQEDIALSAFESLWKGAIRGMYPAIDDRSDLWKLLIVITQRKVLDKLQYDQRLKRCPPKTSEGGGVIIPAVDDVAGQDPTPDMIVEFEEEVRRLLSLLPTEEMRRIALLKTEGYTIEEISKKLNRGHATVERKIRTIRAIWEEQA
ncbi:MAG: ECF-type sigma factor [Pirellulales bacterium]